MVNKLHVLVFEYVQCACFVIFFMIVYMAFYHTCFQGTVSPTIQLALCSKHWPTSWFDWSGGSWWTRPIWTGEFHQSWSLIRLQAPNPPYRQCPGVYRWMGSPQGHANFGLHVKQRVVSYWDTTFSVCILMPSPTIETEWRLDCTLGSMHTDYLHHRTTDSSFVQCWLHQTSHDLNQSANKCPGRARK